MEDKIVQQVVNKYVVRSAIGINKYGTTLEQNNKDNFLIHLQDELMDATLYIQKLIVLEKEITNIVKNTPNDMELGNKIRQLVK